MFFQLAPYSCLHCMKQPCWEALSCDLCLWISGKFQGLQHFLNLGIIWECCWPQCPSRLSLDIFQSNIPQFIAECFSSLAEIEGSASSLCSKIIDLDSSAPWSFEWFPSPHESRIPSPCSSSEQEIFPKKAEPLWDWCSEQCFSQHLRWFQPTEPSNLEIDLEDRRVRRSFYQPYFVSDFGQGNSVWHPKRHAPLHILLWPYSPNLEQAVFSSLCLLGSWNH